uniref:Uncharacterized protein n=1 Tax=Cannabis sativa TaxID=3483 RepID=A0A803NLJ8_CANSA
MFVGYWAVNNRAVVVGYWASNNRAVVVGYWAANNRAVVVGLGGHRRGSGLALGGRRCASESQKPHREKERKLA